MERGSDKHGPMIDEELKHETESLTRGAPVDSRAEEYREQEGAPDVEERPDSRMAGDRQMAPRDYLKSENLEWRHEVARFLQGAAFPADREALLESAEELQATDDVMDMLRSLPSDKTYENLQEVWIDLGGSVEDKRM